MSCFEGIKTLISLYHSWMVFVLLVPGIGFIDKLWNVLETIWANIKLYLISNSISRKIISNSLLENYFTKLFCKVVFDRLPLIRVS